MTTKTIDIDRSELKVGDKIVKLPDSWRSDTITVEREVPKRTFAVGTLVVATRPDMDWDVYLRHANGRWVSPTDERAEDGYFTDDMIVKELELDLYPLRIVHQPTDREEVDE